MFLDNFPFAKTDIKHLNGDPRKTELWPKLRWNLSENFINKSLSLTQQTDERGILVSIEISQSFSKDVKDRKGAAGDGMKRRKSNI